MSQEIPTNIDDWESEDYLKFAKDSINNFLKNKLEMEIEELYRKHIKELKNERI